MMSSMARSTGNGPTAPKVNRLVMAVEIPAKETNETRNNSTPNGWQLTPMYETLIGLDNTTGKRYPALATEWAIEPDGNGYRFKLRQGVQFHKGMGEFTSKDLVQPWKEILKDDSISGVTEFWRQALQDIQPVNDYEVVFRFKRPISEASVSRWLRSWTSCSNYWS